ncbi:1-deoxy-D-xylulose-5-phosphate synthase [Pseudoleptotrichia goodfellowii]|uniref:1-deoxy-D-xylulose-5-phosphate synthase n=1 Tax=Pseudoleptotrichia goodfellowii TaxID=157692 RepID=A0A510JCJ1_9FUSO|nr:1-deoxy-D-xylulose-5-phosphate synthase [Pseudoleptotrichia goodfellowii]BBM36171.1 1-deoxy-D-xylulose-5-phosphate synthase [Pseudoleptotrichia goodfellowii]
MALEKVNSPEDVKKLSKEELKELAKNVREALLNRLTKIGGHIGPNFGMVEVTIALHYVFDSPKDKFVFDVSHQCYPHKILTGRKEGFLNPDKFSEISGYTNQNESKHDFFKVGHTSTSVSLATGLAKARDLKGDKENIIAIIGDGSLSGGEAYEGLNNASEQGTNMIIIANDNDMSIAENHGGLYKTLKELRETDGKSPNNLFKALGLDYIYVKDGHDIDELIKVFESVKDIDHPVVLHIHTIKGKGLPFAETDKEPWHYNAPFDAATGEVKVKSGGKENYSNLTGEYLLKKMEQDPKVVAISSGTPTVLGFTPERRAKAGKQFVDVGIAEEHAVALSSGIAANGGKPVYGVFSTFIQRTYDQLSQDLCINNNPAVILVFMGGMTGMNDITHLGYFDEQILGNIPNMVYLSPTSREEYFAMLEWGIEQQSHPVAIRVPMNVVTSGEEIKPDFSELNKYVIAETGNDVAIIGLGDYYHLGKEVKELLKEKAGMNATLINPRFISGIDEEVLEKLKENHKLVITLESALIDGGFGEKVTRYYGTSNMKVINFGGKKEFTDRVPAEEILKRNHLTKEQIVEDIMGVLNK